MSEAIVTHHALSAFLALPDTNSTSDPAVTVTVMAEGTCINIRGDGDDKEFRDAVNAASGTPLPIAANTLASGKSTLYWLGPDEWLLRAASDADALLNKLSKKFARMRASAVDVSDGYVMLRLAGSQARDVLARGCTLDLRPASFADGQCAQTAIARTSVLVAAGKTGDSMDILVRRTFAEYLALWLRQAGAEYGIRFVLPGSEDA